MLLSNEQHAILAHVVVDPDAWVAHALATVGDQAVLGKIERYRADYLSCKNQVDYKPRAEREEE